MSKKQNFAYGAFSHALLGARKVLAEGAGACGPLSAYQG